MPLDCPDIGAIITEVIETMEMRELEVRSREGRWHLLRVRPYRSLDDRIDGAVLVLFDIDDVKRHELAARAARRLAEAIVDAVTQPLMVVDDRLRVERVNGAYLRMFRTTEGETLGRPLFEIGGGQWSHAELRALIEGVLPANDRFEGLEVECDAPRAGKKRLRVNGRRLDGGEEERLILLTFEDLAPPANA